MKHYVDLDVSVTETCVCIVDGTGTVCREIKVPSHPQDLLRVLQDPAWRLEQIGLEAGPLSQWLCEGLADIEVGGGTFLFVSGALGLPALLAGWSYIIVRKSAKVFPSLPLVLWLRRFQRADLTEFPFPSFMERVCRGIAVPITLQDSTSLRPGQLRSFARDSTC